MAETKKDLELKLKKLEKDRKKLSQANQKLNERVLELYTLYNISKTLSLSLQLDELFETAMKVIGETLNVSQYNLMLLDEATGLLYMQAIHGFEDDNVRKAVLTPGEGLAGKVLKDGNAVVVDNVSKTGEWIYHESEEPIKGSYLGVPLKRPNGDPIGVVNAHKNKIKSFAKDDLRLFEAVAENVAISLENARTYQRTKELSHRDDLTGLYNRRYFFVRFEREVERGKRYNRMFSLILMDLDHFKRYNDTYGHLSGDRALQEVAKALRNQIRKVDIIARYGGEEFVVVLPETHKEDALMVADKLRESVSEIGLGAKEGGDLLTITAGVSSFPLDSTESLELIEIADKALYLGKAGGRNRVSGAVEPGENP